MKMYCIRYNIGRAKYVVLFHDGVKTHPDGSEFFDIEIFHNKKKLQQFVQSLVIEGYRERDEMREVSPTPSPDKRKGYYCVFWDNSGLNNSVGVLFPSERIARNFIRAYENLGEFCRFMVDVYGEASKCKDMPIDAAIQGKNDYATFERVMSVLLPNLGKMRRKQNAFNL